MILIKDAQNLLPSSTTDLIARYQSETTNMVLEIPSHGIMLKHKSLERLLSISQENSIILFQPELPVLSEIGLPLYPVLAYLYPQSLEATWPQVQLNIERSRIKQKQCAHPTRYTLVSTVDADEQLYYFAQCYGQAIKPSYVRIIVSNVCNLKCVMCPYHSPLLKPQHSTTFFKEKKSMPWELMERLAKDCGEAKIPLLIGSIEEPLLHPDLIRFIQFCRESGVPSIHLTTNGQLLNKAKAIALLKAGITSIDISIDAAEAETYLRIRGCNLKKVEDNVITFLKIRDQLGLDCTVRTSFVKNSGVSEEESKVFLQRWLQKVNSVFLLNVAEYKESNIKLKTSNQAVEKIIERYQQKTGGRWACLFPFQEMAILPDGSTYYCIETLFRLGFDDTVQSLGNYHQQSLLEIWSGQLFTELRRDLILNNLEKRAACKECNMWKSQVIHQSENADQQVLTTAVTTIHSQR